MKTGRFQRLFRRAAPVADEVCDALQQLAQVAADRPFLARHCALMSDILPLLFGNGPLPDPQIDREHTLVKLRSATPVLCGESVSLDVPGFQQRWRRLCGSIQRHGASADASRLAGVLDREGWNSEALVREVLAGNIDQIVARAEGEGLSGTQTKMVLRFALFPVLSHLRQQLIDVLAGCRWPKGCCPVCGSWPLLAEFRGLEQLRVLRCGLCAAEWEFPRLQCPYCANRDHHQLAYFHVQQEQDKYRVATCGQCHGYVKTASTLAAFTAPQLFVTDLATLHLDLAARDQGYYQTGSNEGACQNREGEARAEPGRSKTEDQHQLRPPENGV